VLIEVKVPALAESVPDATLLDWYKQPGEAIGRGENLIDLETDKVTLEIAAPEAGVIKELLHQPGDVVLTDTVLCVIDTEGAATTTSSDSAPAAAPPPDNTNGPGPPRSTDCGPPRRAGPDDSYTQAHRRTSVTGAAAKRDPDHV
jgi:2-oxoglutarate dehydrogenase E2 component (dihydrolipoamide succinyltransferase)